MALVPTEKTALHTPQFRPQDEHSVPQGFGSYGLYRLLLRAQHPQLDPANPLAGKLAQALSPRGAPFVSPRLLNDNRGEY